MEPHQNGDGQFTFYKMANIKRTEQNNNFLIVGSSLSPIGVRAYTVCMVVNHYQYKVINQPTDPERCTITCANKQLCI